MMLEGNDQPSHQHSSFSSPCSAQLREGDEVKATVASMQENQATFQLRVAPVSTRAFVSQPPGAQALTARAHCGPRAASAAARACTSDCRCSCRSGPIGDPEAAMTRHEAPS